jgi:hypothetical protein
VRLESESSTYYFCILGATLLFSHPVGSVGHVVHSGASRVRNVDALFFMLQWDRYWFDKNASRHVVPILFFLHLVGSVSHVVHFGASGSRTVDVLFFMLGWDRYGFDKSGLERVTSNMCLCIQRDLWLALCTPVHSGAKHRCTIFHAWVGPVWI